MVQWFMTLHKSIGASRKIVPVCCCIKVAEEYSWHSNFEKNISVKLHDLGHGEKKKLLRLDNFFPTYWTLFFTEKVSEGPKKWNKYLDYHNLTKLKQNHWPPLKCLVFEYNTEVKHCSIPTSVSQLASRQMA